MADQDVAVVQMVSTAVVSENLGRARALVEQAARDGARLVALPENFALMAKRQSDVLAIAEQAGDGPVQNFLSDLARDCGVWLLGGTLPIQGPDRRRVYASSLLIDGQGQQRARYDKIHLYDVSLPGSSEFYRESDTFMAGDSLAVTDTPLGRLGMSICYDLRFPELYRTLQSKGSELIVVPSAFTARTGKAHWHVLLRARAIENLCYILAPNQGGAHANGRATYGHSMIVNPWGEILAEADPGEAIIHARLDRDALHDMRGRFPVLEHGRWNRLQGKQHDD